MNALKVALGFFGVFASTYCVVRTIQLMTSHYRFQKAKKAFDKSNFLFFKALQANDLDKQYFYHDQCLSALSEMRREIDS